jgi:hypothetical protein
MRKCFINGKTFIKLYDGLWKIQKQNIKCVKYHNEINNIARNTSSTSTTHLLSGVA